jgi:flagellar hook-associated protein 3 FlgL
MRITSGHIVELAAAATSRAQQSVADATAVESSGLKVAVPSDDPVAWVTAQRERVRETLSSGNGTAMSFATDQLDETDGALSTISDVVTQARQLAVQGSSDTYSAASRAEIGTQVQALFQSALAAANTQSSNGEYLLGGSKSSAPPFDATGAYTGDSTSRDITVSEHSTQTVTVPGSVLTAANGVDVLPTLAALATALSTNNVAGIQAALGTLTSATTQVSSARAQTGAALATLSSADASRQQLEVTLATHVSNLVEADAIGAASTLAQATQTLDVSRAVTSNVIQALQPPSTLPI